MARNKIYGLIGYPVKHSLSALMHNAAFAHLGINAEYRLFEVKPEELISFLMEPDKEFEDVEGRSIRAGDISGFNITIPYKVRAREILEEKFSVDKLTKKEDLHYVRLSGAVNTIRRDKHMLRYWNTDAPGFLKSLDRDLKFKTSGRSVMLIGCGGAGRAIIAALTWKQRGIKKIYVNDINQAAIEAAEKHFSQFFYLKGKLEFIRDNSRISEKITSCQLLVNATPTGMKDADPSPIDKSLLHKELYVYDVVYNRKTQLIKDAQSLGLPAKAGDGMLLYQGVDAFALWLGKSLSVDTIDIMRGALNTALNKK
ncbi:MAG: hypothetical protein COV72_05875 [Candidatus Omnitrophica bacterium CG11_big_fil_rev_8_21_14_0_20_42_13]|uniref:Shikimate dehydrogenase (NADP(+)) n=1 Tax=Candidatus Ghiorseimicrobium undicola TaxID=1974746 RepID=A0A2H0LWQ2_9BACT|nr:MAG: hypothetical protein COV72_05875 [Candidatus Omnitrophica bacterium CG11_big_fil_rev_8_21_14_0_20_42_13]